MANVTRYGKPSMTNLPPDLGMAIFKQILNTPAPDRANLHKESARLEKAMLRERNREDAQGNTSK